MATTVGTLRAFLDLDTSQFAEGAARARRGFEGLGRDLTSMGRTLSTNVTLPLVAIGTAAVASAVQFENAFNAIRRGTGATGEALEGLKDDFRAVSREVPQDLGEVATAVADLNTRLGLTGEPLQALAAQMLDLARITGSDVTAVVRDSTRAFGDWSIATEGQEAALDAVFRASQATGVPIGNLLSQIVQYGAPMRQFGFDFESAAVLLAKFEKEGVNSELVLGSLRIALGKLSKEGVTDVVGGLQGLITQIRDAGTAAEANTIAFENFGARAGADMAAAIREGRLELGDLLDTVRGGTDTIRSAGADTLSFADQFRILKKDVMEAIEPIGVLLLGAIRAVLPAMKAMIALLGEVVSAFTSLPAPVQTAVLVIAGLFAAAGPILLALGLFVKTVVAIFAATGPILAAVKGFAVALAFLFSPAGAVAVALAAALFIWFKWGDDIVAVVSALVGTIRDWLVDRLGAIVASVRERLEPIIAVFRMIGQAIGAVLAPVGEVFSAAAGAIVDAAEPVTNQVRALSDRFVGLGASVAEAGEAAATFSLDAVTTAADSATTAVQGLAGALVPKGGGTPILVQTKDELDALRAAAEPTSQAMQALVAELERTIPRTEYEQLTVAFQEADTATREWADNMARLVIQSREQARETERVTKEWGEWIAIAEPFEETFRRLDPAVLAVTRQMEAMADAVDTGAAAQADMSEQTHELQRQMQPLADAFWAAERRQIAYTTALRDGTSATDRNETAIRLTGQAYADLLPAQQEVIDRIIRSTAAAQDAQSAFERMTGAQQAMRDSGAQLAITLQDIDSKVSFYGSSVDTASLSIAAHRQALESLRTAGVEPTSEAVVKLKAELDNLERVESTKSALTDMFDSVFTALDKSITGIIQGTTDLATAFKDLGQSIALEFGQKVLQAVLEPIKKILVEIVVLLAEVGLEVLLGLFGRGSGPGGSSDVGSVIDRVIGSGSTLGQVIKAGKSIWDWLSGSGTPVPGLNDPGAGVLLPEFQTDTFTFDIGLDAFDNIPLDYSFDHSFEHSFDFEFDLSFDFDSPLSFDYSFDPGFSTFPVFGGDAFATGGPVPGSGLGDTVPAMLTPGEFVVRRDVAQANLPMLEELNRGGAPAMHDDVLHFAEGGKVPGEVQTAQSTISWVRNVLSGGMKISDMLGFGDQVTAGLGAIGVTPELLSLASGVLGTVGSLFALGIGIATGNVPATIFGAAGTLAGLGWLSGATGLIAPATAFTGLAGSATTITTAGALAGTLGAIGGAAGIGAAFYAVYSLIQMLTAHEERPSQTDIFDAQRWVNAVGGIGQMAGELREAPPETVAGFLTALTGHDETRASYLGAIKVPENVWRMSEQAQEIRGIVLNLFGENMQHLFGRMAGEEPEVFTEFFGEPRALGQPSFLMGQGALGALGLRGGREELVDMLRAIVWHHTAEALGPMFTGTDLIGPRPRITWSDAAFLDFDWTTGVSSWMDLMGGETIQMSAEQLWSERENLFANWRSLFGPGQPMGEGEMHAILSPHMESALATRVDPGVPDWLAPWVLQNLLAIQSQQEAFPRPVEWAAGAEQDLLLGGLPTFATGGIVPGPIGSPVLAMVHGGEEVIPAGEGRGGRGALTVNVTVNGRVEDPHELARSIAREVRRINDRESARTAVEGRHRLGR